MLSKGSGTISGQAALLGWVQRKIAPSGVNVVNFTSNWSDGRALCALLALVDPAAVRECHFGGATAQLEALRTAVRAFERLGVAPLMDPEDMVEGDRLSMMTYLSEIRKRWGTITSEEPDTSRVPEPDTSRVPELALPASPTVAPVDVASPDAVPARVRELERENTQLRLRVEHLERDHDRLRKTPPPKSPRGRPPTSPQVLVSPHDAYPLRSVLVALVASALVWLASRSVLGVLPDVPVVPAVLCFEVVRFFGVVALSFPLFVGVALIASGAALAWLSDQQRIKSGATTLLQFGYYGVSRNPFYLGCAAALVGCALALNALASLLLAAAWVTFVHTVILPDEEKRLREAYEDEWEFYAQNVPRWLGPL